MVFLHNGILLSNEKEVIHTIVWMMSKVTMLSERCQRKRIYTVWFHSHKILVNANIHSDKKQISNCTVTELKEGMNTKLHEQTSEGPETASYLHCAEVSRKPYMSKLIKLMLYICAICCLSIAPQKSCKTIYISKDYCKYMILHLLSLLFWHRIIASQISASYINNWKENLGN